MSGLDESRAGNHRIVSERRWFAGRELRILVLDDGVDGSATAALDPSRSIPRKRRSGKTLETEPTHLGLPAGKVPPVPPENRWTVRATFSEPGTYVLRALAHDGGLLDYDDVTIQVTR